MLNKKGVALPVLGSVLIALVTVIIAYLGAQGGEFLRSKTEKAGKAISLVNFAEALRKMTDESLDIIAKRSAYNLGKVGGVRGSDTAVWTTRYPNMKQLKKILENEVKESLPSSNIKDDREVTWRSKNISISIIYSPNPVVHSIEFLVGGSINFSVYDQSIDSEIKVNHKFDHLIGSSYFKLLHIGRKILDDTTYFDLLTNNFALLETTIETDFNIDASIKDSGDYWNITLKDVNCLLTDDFYCIAPLRADEPKLVIWKGKNIPYDYLTLNFRIKKGPQPSREYCGNEVIDGLEECDDGDLGGEDCITRGYDSGVLRCIDPGLSNECMFDESGCHKIIAPIAIARVDTVASPITQRAITIKPGETAYFDGFTWSFDIDGSIVEYAWDFNSDGVFEDLHGITHHVYGMTGVTSSPSVGAGAFSTTITFPTNEEYFNLGESIIFDSMVSGGTPPYAFFWNSSIDGNIYTGYSFTFSYDNLTVGDHTIILWVSDANGAMTADSIIIHNGVPPYVACPSGDHSICSQACDWTGIQPHWDARQLFNPATTWIGECWASGGGYGCMTGECCIGQCGYVNVPEANRHCFCDITETVNVYPGPGNRVCPVGALCGSDCKCHLNCGDGVLDPWEECDIGIDKDPNTGDDINPNCPNECLNSCLCDKCDNGIQDPGEECDPPMVNSPQCLGGDCESNCKCGAPPPECGNGLQEPAGGEECDDGNLLNGDGCSATCTIEQRTFEAKLRVKDNDGALGYDTVYVTVRGASSKCGNNNPEPGEECDDGNLLNGDGCSRFCLNEICNNGRVDANEDCDPPKLNDNTYCGGYECKADCKCAAVAICGNNIRESTEKCDCGTTPDCTDDGGGDLGGEDCITRGYIGGTLRCRPPGPYQCSFDESGCDSGGIIVEIISPDNGNTFKQFSDSITFNGSASGGTPPYKYDWTSDRDGLIAVDAKTFSKSDLTVGDHTITLTVTDAVGRLDRDLIIIHITSGPILLSASITSPNNGDTFNLGDSINFASSAIGGTPPYAFFWNSNIDGNIQNSQTFNYNGLSEGDHTITLTVTDSVPATDTDSITIHITNLPALPPSFDWSHKVLPAAQPAPGDWMSPVKNQLHCGSCWAFAAMAPVEAKWNIQKDDSTLDINLSEQYIISCSGGGCHGDNSVTALDYIKNSGVADNPCFSYVGIDSSGCDADPGCGFPPVICPSLCTDSSPLLLWKINGWNWVADDRYSIKQNLIDNGPLAATIDMGHWLERSITSPGSNDCTDLLPPPNDVDHGVVIVGYDDSDSTWIVRNSWSDGWGPFGNGYFKVKYGNCNIEKYSTMFVETVINP